MATKTSKYLTLRRIAKILVMVLVLFMGLILFIRSPWGQQIIVNEVVDYFSEKTGTKIAIRKLFVTFSGNVQLEGLYIEDKKGDTLLFSRMLEADVALSPLIFNNSLELDDLDWNGVTAKIKRKADEETFNFGFILDAFLDQDPEKETETTESSEIIIGTIQLQDFHVVYDDRFLGIISEIDLGSLLLRVDTFDVEAMRFTAEDFELHDSQLSYRQTKLSPRAKDASTTKTPSISVNNFRVQNLLADYHSEPDQLQINGKIGNFSLELPLAEIAESNFEIGDLLLHNSNISITSDAKKTPPQDSFKKTNNISVDWPSYSILASKIDLQGNTLSYKSADTKTVQEAFNLNNFVLKQFDLVASDLVYQSDQAELTLQTLSFLEKSGFHLRNMNFKSSLAETSLILKNLFIQTGNSSLHGGATLKYHSLEQLINSPQLAELEASLPQINIGLEDVVFFQPVLADNTYFQIAKQHPISGQLFASGTLDTFNLEDTQLKWGENTSLALTGMINNSFAIDSLSFDLEQLKAISSRQDIQLFVKQQNLGIAVPQNAILSATAQGNFKKFNASASLKIPEGTAKLQGSLSFKNQFSFNGMLEIDSLRLDKLLNNDQFRAVSLTYEGAFSGSILRNLDADFTTDISRFEYKAYEYKNVLIEGKINNGEGNLALQYKDSNLNLNSDIEVLLDSTAYDVQMTLDLKGADLNALNVATNNIKVGADLKSRFKGLAKDFTFNTEISQAIAVIDNKQYQTDDINILARVGSRNTHLEVRSGFLNGKLDSNSSPEHINAALQRQFLNYFSEDLKASANIDSVSVRVNAELTPEPILTEVFFRGLQRLDTVTLDANFNTATENLYAALYIPSAQYNTSMVDSLNIRIDGDPNNLNFSAGIAGLTYEPVKIKNTFFEGTLENRQLLLDFVSFDGNKKLMHIASEMQLKKDTVNLHINPSGLVFNNKEWSIPKDNLITFSEAYLHVENIIFSRDDQRLELTDAVPQLQDDHFGLLFENFRLQTLFSLLNPDEKLASGVVKGNLILENPYGATGLVADFKIDELAILENPLGDLYVQGTSSGFSKYNIDMAMKDGGVDLDLTGNYTASEQGASLDMYMDLKKLETKVIQGFFSQEIAQPEGYLSGQLDISGTLTNPIYEGQISFNDTALEVVPLNTLFRIDKETVDIDEAKVSLKQFDIQDAKGNLFTIDGNIETKNLNNPNFNLNLVAEQFRLLNSTEKDNELYHGIMSVDANMQIAGDLNLPVVNGKVRVRKVTELTYIVPEEQLDIQERDGVVIFVNKENPDAILTRNEEEQTPNILRGFDIDMTVEIAEDAIFTIVLDERSDDRLQVQGDAILNLTLDQNGTIGLTGRYELNNGFYRTSLYNLVSRKFDIKSGSTITWQGDPLDARLDVTAIYQVETSAAPLMASVTSGVEASLASQYQQVMPFLVYLNVDGEIMEPKISFDLGVPDDAQGDLGGGVYGRVQQLNEQESELNKQVFSLLAFNRFFPNTGSDGSSGGTTALARNNVNKVLSGELNAFSEKVFGNSGFEVDFDLDSFTDYRGETAQDRTQLNINAKKRFFDDRLIVTAGSAVDVEGSAQTGQEETPIIGNVSLEYLLTENGRYRLKGFRKSEFANVIDGQLIVTGLALIFDREFNSFSELFNPMKQNEENDPNKTTGKKEKENDN